MTDYRKPAGKAPEQTDPDEARDLGNVQRAARFLEAARKAAEKRIVYGDYEYDVRVGPEIDGERICEVHIFKTRRLVWWKFWEEKVLCLVEVELVRGFSVYWKRPDGTWASTPGEVMSRAIDMHEVLEETKERR